VTDINSDYGAVTSGTDRAVSGLPTRADGKPAGPGVDPRLTAAVGDTDEQTRKGRDKVREGADKAKKYTKGLSDIQDEAGRGVRDVSNKSSMPSMPSVPQSSPAPQAAAPTPTPAPAPSMPSTPAPSGLATIDPGLLAALVEASQDRAAVDAAEGIVPGLDGDPASASSATSPQNPQPLDVSQVSLEEYPGGALSKEQIAGVIDQALTINGVPNDPALRAQWQELYQHMAAGESGGDPNARNLWDSNATGAMMPDGAYANSSRGMWQCIPSTFAAYHMGGTSTSIYDPVASAAASMNYVMDRYNVSPGGQGLDAFMARQGVGTASYQGY